MGTQRMTDHEHEELRDQLNHATTVVCPRCVRGSVTGPNGEHWRCAFCGGTGLLREPADDDD